MATSTYMNNRKGWSRPQALLFANKPGTLQSNFYIPDGNEFVDFIILSDHNRGGLNMSKQRIETRNRMINGSMRSYHTADKINISTSWSRLPSRSYSATPEYENGIFIKQPDPEQPAVEEYTVDGGAGGADLLDWYEDHPGPFWVFLSYDKFGEDNINRYTQVIQMYFSGFDYEIEKRGQAWSNGTTGGFDMWNISMSLEQV